MHCFCDTYPFLFLKKWSWTHCITVTIWSIPFRIWTPDFLMYNSASSVFNNQFATNIVVYSDGVCEFLPPGNFLSTCQVSFFSIAYNVDYFQKKTIFLIILFRLISLGFHLMTKHVFWSLEAGHTMIQLSSYPWERSKEIYPNSKSTG